MKNLLNSKVSLYDFEVETIDGKTINLCEYKNRVLLIVNVASNCKFTSQYKDLEHLYQKYKDDGLLILAFPCNQFCNQEPLSNEKIKNFCTSTYNVTFPIFSKIEVNGNNTHPLYKFLKSSMEMFLGPPSVKWNFTKFLVDKEGNIVKRYSTIIQPFSIEDDISKLLNQ